jgi:hypothetical protein
MGMNEWLKKQQQKIKDKLNKEQTPEEQKAAKKEQARKAADLTMKTLKLAKQGADQYKKVAGKVEDIKEKAAEKTIELAEKAKPIAEKIDSAAGALAKKAKGLFKKPEENNGIIDLIVPAVPKDDSPKP